ncbi:hypothetical protein J6590_034208 [Homalodisca vitripennis]|nr:hypothetical protein J6590_034208 [Homalodisca vitripennis]
MSSLDAGWPLAPRCRAPGRPRLTSPCLFVLHELTVGPRDRLGPGARSTAGESQDHRRWRRIPVPCEGTTNLSGQTEFQPELLDVIYGEYRRAEIEWHGTVTNYDSQPLSSLYEHHEDEHEVSVWKGCRSVKEAAMADTCAVRGNDQSIRSNRLVAITFNWCYLCSMWTRWDEGVGNWALHGHDTRLITRTGLGPEQPSGAGARCPTVYPSVCLSTVYNARSSSRSPRK